MKLMIAQGIDLFFQIIYWIMIARILLSWYPNLDWYRQPFRAIKEITDPILEPFSRIIPPMGGIDFSPIVAFLALYILRYVILLLIMNI